MPGDISVTFNWKPLKLVKCMYKCKDKNLLINFMVHQVVMLGKNKNRNHNI